MLPFALVLQLGMPAERWPPLVSPLKRGLVVFGIGAAVEVLQWLGVPIFGRTADPWDLLMYAAGSGAGLLFERYAFAAPAPARPS